MSFYFPLIPLLLLPASALLLAQRTAAEPADWREQLARMPAEFREALLVPRWSELWLDGRSLGEVEAELGRDGSVRLLPVVDAKEDAELARWRAYLAQPRALGPCARECPEQLLALEYDIAESRLKLLTGRAELAAAGAFYALPASGGDGLLLSNDLSLSGAGQEQLTGRYNLDVSGSLGQWTLAGGLQLAQSAARQQRWRQTLGHWYAQREWPRHFFRAGRFAPGAQGMVRMPGRSGDTVVGVMAGSSDALLRDSEFPSLSPIQVSAEAASVAELYRDGVLLYSQRLDGGLQALDTKRLPGGIYPVELRVSKDGVELIRRREWVYKPQRWGDPERRWRYNLFAGQRSLAAEGRLHQGHGWSAGGILNYLWHPRLLLGAAALWQGERGELGASLDWELAERLRLDGGVFLRDCGQGWHAQLARTFATGGLQLGMEQQWQPQGQAQRQWSAAWQRQLGERNSVSLNLRHEARGGVGVDLGLNRRQRWKDRDVDLRLTLFDQPGAAAQPRRRGMEAGLSLSLGESRRSVNVSLGRRSNEAYAAVNVQQQWEQSALRSAGVGLNADSRGVGVNGSLGFSHALADGSAYLSRGANHRFSGGLNLRSTVALGGGGAALSGGLAGGGGGMIVEVETDQPDAALSAQGRWGAQRLRPGRNLVPVSAYQPGRLNFSLGQAAGGAALSLRPASAGYHLNRGGVGYQKLKLMRVVTVMGRLLDAAGQPWAGASLVNHAGRTLSDVGGVFTLDVHASTPELSVERAGVKHCQLVFDPATWPRDGEVVFLGDIGCPEQLAGGQANDQENAG
ncbi:CS1-pili formation C-terminal domain-containing protein [Chromobacterium indicum]|uniref:CS1-pili formation C-terminal domain-containing protein n=1 Tax=Chromobacterium indicum TaxID=3110228 RepID=UPI003216D8B3